MLKIYLPFTEAHNHTLFPMVSARYLGIKTYSWYFKTLRISMAVSINPDYAIFSHTDFLFTIQNRLKSYLQG